jgi:hypothetical protein
VGHQRAGGGGALALLVMNLDGGRGARPASRWEPALRGVIIP